MPLREDQRSSSTLPAALLEALLVVVVLLLHYMRNPLQVGSAYMGDVRYGAYQGTLWWYHHVRTHLLEPSAWLHSDMMAYPFGFSPYELYAGDVLAALLYAPFAWLLPDALATNIFILLALGSAALAAAAVVQRMGGARSVALAGGLLFVCNPLVANQVQYGRLSLLLLLPIPIFILQWTRALAPGAGRGPVVCSGLALAVTTLIYPYYGLFLGLLAAAMAAWASTPLRVRALRLAAMGGMAVPLTLPLMWPLLKDYGDFSDFQNTTQICAPVLTNLPANFSPMIEHSTSLPALSRLVLHPLILILLVGVFVKGRVRRWSAVGIVAVVLSMGPYLIWARYGKPPCLTSLPLPYWLFLELVPGGKALSHPNRFLVIAFAAALPVAAGLLSLASPRWRGRVERLALPGVIVALLALAPQVIRSSPVQAGPSLAAVGDGEAPLIIVPLNWSDFYILPQLEHGRPMFNVDGLGVSYKQRGELPDLLRENSFARFLMALGGHGPISQPDPHDTRFFVDNGFQHVVVARWVLDQPPSPGIHGKRPTAEHLAQARDRVMSGLRSALGAPVAEDEYLVVFDIPGPPESGPSAPAPGWRTILRSAPAGQDRPHQRHPAP